MAPRSSKGTYGSKRENENSLNLLFTLLRFFAAGHRSSIDIRPSIQRGLGSDRPCPCAFVLAYLSLINLAATAALDSPTSLDRKRNWRFKFVTSMVSAFARTEISLRRSFVRNVHVSFSSLTKIHDNNVCHNTAHCKVLQNLAAQTSSADDQHVRVIHLLRSSYGVELADRQGARLVPEAART